MNTSSNAVRGAETATEQLQLELERLRSELDRCTTRLQLTEKLLEHVADAVFVADLDGRIIDVNPAACSLLGYERQELLKMRPWDFATSASWQGILALIGTMELGDPVTVQRAYRCKSGEQKIVDVRLTRENHAGRDLIVVFSREVTEQKSPEPGSRQNDRMLAESQQFTNAYSTALDVTEGARIEEALRRSEEYRRLTIDTIPILAWCSRPDGSNEFLNQRWLDYTGLSIEAARDWGWKVAIHPEDLSQLLDVWHKLLASGEPGELEARLRRFDGVYRWFLFRVEPLFDETGNIVKWYGTNTDIDDRKWAEAVLGAEKKILELITGNNSLATILEALCRLVEEMFSGSLCAILFLDADGKRLRKGIAPSFPPDFMTAVDGVNIGPRVGSCGTAAYRKETVIVSDINTDPLWANYRQLALAYELQAGWSTPILTAQEAVLGTFAIYSREPRSPRPQERKLLEQFAHVARVAIEHARAQESLRRSEAKYRDLIDVSPDAIYIIDTDLNYVLANPAGAELAGCTQEELIGTPIAETFVPGERPLLPARMEMMKTEPYLRFERKFVRRNGDIVPVDVSLTTVRGQYLQAVLRDISERKRSEETLRASEQMARGQVEALTYSLDVLATAPEPEKFLGKMLSTICRLLTGQSATLWLFDEPTDSLILRLVVDSVSPVGFDPEHPLIQRPRSWKENPVIHELFFAAGPIVCEDIETDPRVNDQFREYFMPKGTKKFLAVPILVGGQVRGMITVRHGERVPYRTEEIGLLQALAHQVMLAIRLTEVGEQSRQAAVLAERNRMARDVHDTLAQGFTGVIVQLEAAEYAMSEGDREDANRHLLQAGELARRSLSEARRSVHALRPLALEEANFWQALKGFFKNTTVGTSLLTTFEAKGKVPVLPPAWQENLLRIGQEALTNTLKYARARNFRTRFISNSKQLRLELRDDGNGFKIEERNDGVGLSGMRERAEEMGGKLKIASARGKGTTITVILPLNRGAVSLARPSTESLPASQDASERPAIPSA
jgi:PAS domain S-box-containing protein